MERRKSHSQVGVGKMILDILPRKVDVDSEKQARSHVAAWHPSSPARSSRPCLPCSCPPRLPIPRDPRSPALWSSIRPRIRHRRPRHPFPMLPP
ncbi:hypothetical protein NUW54_g8182 [Trametes sanguinea]|uniref:Uncharacterized protein n=1 Tax=Trametes sanguinea TaxID=158606 RepID=A0ACC1PFT3_9APHY|nr:hypothetical protein NUW54_g8182 [Trametes sanguinea]